MGRGWGRCLTMDVQMQRDVPEATPSIVRVAGGVVLCKKKLTKGAVVVVMVIVIVVTPSGKDGNAEEISGEALGERETSGTKLRTDILGWLAKRRREAETCLCFLVLAVFFWAALASYRASFLPFEVEVEV